MQFESVDYNLSRGMPDKMFRKKLKMMSSVNLIFLFSRQRIYLKENGCAFL